LNKLKSQLNKKNNQLKTSISKGVKNKKLNQQLNEKNIKIELSKQRVNELQRQKNGTNEQNLQIANLHKEIKNNQDSTQSQQKKIDDLNQTIKINEQEKPNLETHIQELSPLSKTILKQDPNKESESVQSNVNKKRKIETKENGEVNSESVVTLNSYLDDEENIISDNNNTDSLDFNNYLDVSTPLAKVILEYDEHKIDQYRDYSSGKIEKGILEAAKLDLTKCLNRLLIVFKFAEMAHKCAENEQYITKKQGEEFFNQYKIEKDNIFNDILKNIIDVHLGDILLLKIIINKEIL
jgi:hypothetical protein